MINLSAVKQIYLSKLNIIWEGFNWTISKTNGLIKSDYKLLFLQNV